MFLYVLLFLSLKLVTRLFIFIFKVTFTYIVIVKSSPFKTKHVSDSLINTNPVGKHSTCFLSSCAYTRRMFHQTHSVFLSVHTLSSTDFSMPEELKNSRFYDVILLGEFWNLKMEKYFMR